MNKYEWEKKKNKEALDFFKKFIGWLTRGKVKVLGFGWWHIAEGKFGLSMYWNMDE